MTYIYLLSAYDEYGSEGVRAFSTREKVLENLMKDYENSKNRELLFTQRKNWFTGMTDEQKEKYFLKHVKDMDKLQIEINEIISKLFEKTDNEIYNDGNPHNLESGWGGTQLHVVKLDA